MDSELATGDRRTARRVAAAHTARVTADAASQRRIREAEAHARLDREHRAERAAQRHAARQAERVERVVRRRDRAEWRAGAWARRRRTAQAVVDYVRGNAPAVYSAVVYGLAVAVAVAGQISIATSHHLPVIAGIGMAGFLEGLALSMALTAHQLRMRGERALAPRALTWVAACFAAGLNYTAHDDSTMLAMALAAASLVGIIVWEVRSGAKHRPALRTLGMIPSPGARFGARRWLRYPISTARAWSLDVRDRVGPGAAVLLRQVETDRHRRTIASAARKTARRAARRGQAGPALAALVHLADHVDTGLPTRPALPATPTTTAAANARDVPGAGRPGVEPKPSSAAGVPERVYRQPTPPVPVPPDPPVTPPGTDTPAPACTGAPGPRTTTETAGATRDPGKASHSDAELLAILAGKTGPVSVRAAARELGCGVDRARRLLRHSGLLAPDPDEAAPATNPRVETAGRSAAAQRETTPQAPLPGRHALHVVNQTAQARNDR